MIQPVNGHLLIEPVSHETFIASQNDKYQEIGVVISIADDLKIGAGAVFEGPVRIGDRVFFDSWLAAKFPKNDNEHYWLVKWEDVRAIENAEQKIPE